MRSSGSSVGDRSGSGGFKDKNRKKAAIEVRDKETVEGGLGRRDKNWRNKSV